MDGVRYLIISLAMLAVGQLSVQAATQKTLDPKGISIFSVSETVNTTASQKSVIVPISTDKDIAHKEAEVCKKKALAMDNETSKWAQMLQFNDHSVFIRVKF